jgi:hypothetical protein
MARNLVLAAVTAMAVAGCGGSGYTYHANQDEQLFFKLPETWTVFDTDDFTEAGADDSPGLWRRGFVAGADPTIDEVFSITSEQPRGYVEVLPLDVMARDTLSLATLRGANLGTDGEGNPLDPLVYAQENPNGEIQILGYDDNVVYDNGPHGVHIRVAVTPQDSTTTAIIDQTALVDAATSRRYVLSIGCSSSCFDRYEDEIEEVIESWTLEAR